MTDTSNHITLRKQPNGHASDFDIYIDHFQTTDGTGQTDLKIRFSHHAPVSTITLETTPEQNSAAAIARWVGLLNDLRVIAKPTGRNITLMDLHLLDKDKTVVDKSFDGTETKKTDEGKDNSRAAFLGLVREYMLQNADRAITPRRVPRIMNGRTRDFKGLSLA